MIFSYDLIRFITGIPVLNDGTIPTNKVSSNIDSFESTLYEPIYALSTVARLVKQEIDSHKIKTNNTPVGEQTIVHKALNSDLATFVPDIYLLIRAVVLESFSLMYTIDTKVEDLQYMSTKDMKRIRENIGYITDYLSTETKYYHMIETLRDMDISFGYLENQIDVIISERGVS